MRTNTKSSSPRTGTRETKVTPLHDCIKLGIDWHARQYTVCRIVDDGTPEHVGKFTPEAFLIWVKKELRRAKVLRSCYEAGAGGFVLHRQLVALGVKNIVIAPRKLDLAMRRVQNDKLDARDLVMEFDRLLRGNKQALREVFVPSPEQEQKRCESRQRRQLQGKKQALAHQGRSLLLAQGWRWSNSWWKPTHWMNLQKELPQWIVELLETWRQLIEVIEKAERKLIAKIKKAAPTVRPRGLGPLGLEEIVREVADFDRFKNRKAPGAYTGLTGGVLATDDEVLDLPITKAGNSRLRTMMVEAAWRWVFYQPESKLTQRWRHVLLNKQAHLRARKRAIIALARQLLVDLWRWQTHRATPEQLGWAMNG